MIPELLLEQILSGEKNEKDYYGRYGKDELVQALESLRKSNEEILKLYPAERIEEELLTKALENKNEKLVKKNRGFFSHNWQLPLAAALAFAFLSPVIIKNSFFNKSPAAEDSAGERVKGNAGNLPRLRLYRQSGNEAVLLKDGEEASENDLIQITYIPGEYRYGLIFSVDGNGSLTRHFPEDSWTAAELSRTGEEVPLSFSYSLDAAPDYECFVFVASKKDFDMSAIEKLSKGSFSIDYLKKGSYLPEDCDGSVFVLNKK